MEIRNYQKGDEHEILALFQLSFGKPLSMEYWKWRFLENPNADTNLISLMYDNNQLVGHYAVSPINLLMNNEVVKTALSMTTMTHPQYGGKGIFTQLAADVYSKMKNTQYQMVWGFPNNNSHYGFIQKLSWKDIAIQGILSYQNPIESNPQNVQYQCHVTFTKEMIEMLNKESTAKIRIQKNEAFLNWRYLQNPTAIYKIISVEDNWVVYKIYNPNPDNAFVEIDLVELHGKNDPKGFSKIIDAIRLEEGPISKFNIWTQLHGSQQSSLEKIGFKLSTPSTYFSALPFSEMESMFLNYKNWEINFGYSDLY